MSLNLYTPATSGLAKSSLLFGQEQQRINKDADFSKKIQAVTGLYGIVIRVDMAGS